MNINSSNNNTDSENFIGLKWSSYMWIIISLLGIITNFINICVFLNPKLKDISYNYMLSNSITTFFYLIFLFMDSFFVVCINCQSSQTYFASIYNILINGYFTSCLAIFRILTDVTLSVRTLQILKNKKWLEKVSYKWILTIWFVFSLIFYAPQVFAYDICAKQSSIQSYYMVLNNFGRTIYYVIITNIETSIRLFLAVIVLGAVNVLNVVEFKKRFNHGIFKSPTILNQHICEPPDGSQKNARSKATKHLNRMVIFVSFMNAIGTVPFATMFILRISDLRNDSKVNNYYNVALSLLLLSYSSDIFNYYYFNKLYRSVLKKFIKNIFSIF